MELTITLPWAEVKAVYGKKLEEMVKSVTVKGFRKGKAPKKLAEESIDKDQIYGAVIQGILPQAYIEAIKEQSLSPIVNPKIELVAAKENQDWVFRALTCERPKVELSNYKEEIKKLTAKSKIIIPGKESPSPKFEEILEVLLKSVHLEIPELLLESEVNRLLAKTLEEIKTLGLTLEQYLSSIGKTPQALREEYTQKAVDDLKLEFILDEIADTEKIAVSEEDLDQAIEKATDPKAKETLSTQRYLLAAILRRQKTLDFLKNL